MLEKGLLMGIFRFLRDLVRFLLTGEVDEPDKDRLAYNLRNKRRKVDARLKKSAPDSKSTPTWKTWKLDKSPEEALVEIYETYMVLTSWGVSAEEALDRIETYRRLYFGSGQFRRTYNLKEYIGYRLSIESNEWPKSPTVSDLLISSGIDRCQRFFAKFPPDVFVSARGEPERAEHLFYKGTATSILPNLLRAPVDDLSAERNAGTSATRWCLDQLQIYTLKGDRIWKLVESRHGINTLEGYALLRGETIVKAVISSWACVYLGR